MPYHPALDRASRVAGGQAPIGTTGKGLGPAYADKVGADRHPHGRPARRGALPRELEFNIQQKNRLLAALYDEQTSTVDEHPGDLRATRRGARAATSTDTALLAARRDRGRASASCFEGAQGTLLDIDHGTYPFVTSLQHHLGRRLHRHRRRRPQASTACSASPRPTDARGRRPVSHRARRRIGERSASGATSTARSTGRPRRCGWVDAVALRYAARINGLDTSR